MNATTICPHCQAPLMAVFEIPQSEITTGVFDDKLYYNSTQAAKALGVGRKTLLAIRKSGNLKFRIKKSNGRAMYLGADLKKYYNHSSLI